MIIIFKSHVEKLPKEFSFFWAVYYYFCGENQKSLLYLKESMKESFDAKIDEVVIIEYFWEPFKQGFDGFWKEIYNELQKYKTERGVLEYCKLIGEFYSLKTNEEVVDLLSAFIQQYPEYISPKELLAATYQELKMWKNSIALLE